MSENSFHENDLGELNNEADWESLKRVGADFGRSSSGLLNQPQYTGLSPQLFDTTDPYSTYTAQQGSIMPNQYLGYPPQGPPSLELNLYHDNPGGMSVMHNFEPFVYQGDQTDVYTHSPNSLGGEWNFGEFNYSTPSNVPEISISGDGDGDTRQFAITEEDLDLLDIQSPDKLHPASAASSDAGYTSASSSVSASKRGDRVNKPYRRKPRLKERNSEGIPTDDLPRWSELQSIPDEEKTVEQEAEWDALKHALASYHSRKKNLARSLTESPQDENSRLKEKLSRQMKTLRDLRRRVKEADQRADEAEEEAKETRSRLEEVEKQIESQRKRIKKLPQMFPSNPNLRSEVKDLLKG